MRPSRTMIVAALAGWIASLALALYILREDLASAALIGLGIIVLAVGCAIVASGAAQRRRLAISGQPVRVSPVQMALGVLFVVLGLAALGTGLVKLFTDELERQRDAAAAQPASPDSSARRLSS